MGAAFFIASTVHVPVGVGSVHLVLNGLAGLLLGWSVFPLFFVALLLQAALFSFGGFMVLGANLLTMAVPAVLCHLLLAPWLSDTRQPAVDLHRGWLRPAGCRRRGLDRQPAADAQRWRLFDHLIGLLVLSHVPVFIVDALISALTLVLLWRMLPGVLREARP
ncbi:energy-coupling factor ABC transporter permease [Halopseudomonas pachastrellae]|nr:energy-coupling factor ABC transporter permease [Halopseudomonas pachastrellae]